MSCCQEQERPFWVLVLYRGTGDSRSAAEPSEPSKIVQPAQVELGRSPEEVRKRVEANFFRNDPDGKYEAARVEVVVEPFQR